MAKIIYGVSGQGFGHSTRSKEIINYLFSKGHEILIFTYGQALFFLGDFAKGLPASAGGPANSRKVFEIPGLGLHYQDNRLRYRRTLYQNAKQIIRQSKNWKKILNQFRTFNPDLALTDFEPLTALLAKLQRVPLVSLDNQHQLTNTKIEVPKQYKKDLLADKLVIKSLVWGADYYLITSFFETPVTKKNTFLFPPVIRQEVLALQPKKEDYILVYQNSQSYQFINQLKSFKQRFVIFGLNIEKNEGNLIFKNYSSREWLDYLAGSRAIIGTAGLSLISEGLYLQKPYLALPVKRQVEQIINAQYLQKMGYGHYSFKLTENIFNNFLADLPQIENRLRNYQRQDNSAIFKKLDEIINLLG